MYTRNKYELGNIHIIVPEDIPLPYCTLCGIYFSRDKSQAVSGLIRHLYRKHRYSGKALEDARKLLLTLDKEYPIDSCSINWNADKLLPIKKGLQCTLCNYVGVKAAMNYHFKVNHPDCFLSEHTKQVAIKKPFHKGPAIPVDAQVASQKAAVFHPVTNINVSDGSTLVYCPSVNLIYCHRCKYYIQRCKDGISDPVIHHLRNNHKAGKEELHDGRLLAKMVDTTASTDINWLVDDTRLPILDGFRCLVEGCTWVGTLVGIKKHFADSHSMAFSHSLVKKCFFKRPFYGHPGVQVEQGSLHFIQNISWSDIHLSTNVVVRIHPHILLPYCLSCAHYFKIGREHQQSPLISHLLHHHNISKDDLHPVKALLTALKDERIKRFGYFESDGDDPSLFEGDSWLPDRAGLACTVEGCQEIGSDARMRAHFRQAHPTLRKNHHTVPAFYKLPYGRGWHVKSIV